MKWLARIQEFTSLLFNKPNGDDLEIKPASRAKSSDAEIAYDLPDGSTPVGDADDTLVLAAETQTLTNKSINADANTITNIDNADIKAAAAIEFSKMEALTIDRALITNGSGEVVPSDVTAAEIAHLDGVTSGIQGQLDSMVEKAGDTMTGNLTLTGANIVMSGLETVDGRDVSVDGAALDLHLTDDTLSKHDADQIDFDNTTSGLTAVNVQAAIDEVEGRLDTTESNTSTNTSNISANTSDIADLRTTTGTADGDTNLGTFTGATIPDSSSVKSALQSLETAHETHTSATSAHGVSGDVVGTTDAQTLTNKTLTALKYSETNITAASSIATPAETVIHLTGISTPLQAMTGGADGDLRLIMNDTNATVVVEDNFGVDGFTFGSDIDLLVGGTVQVIYDSTTSRWRVIGVAQGTSVSTASYARIFLNM